MLSQNAWLLGILILAIGCLLATLIVLLDSHRHAGRAWRSNTTKID